MNSIYASLNSNRKLFTNEFLNVDRVCSRCVFQEILTPSLVHILTFDFARAILVLSEMRRQLMNNQFQQKRRYGLAYFDVRIKTIVWRD